MKNQELDNNFLLQNDFKAKSYNEKEKKRKI